MSIVDSSLPMRYCCRSQPRTPLEAYHRAPAYPAPGGTGSGCLRRYDEVMQHPCHTGNRGNGSLIAKPWFRPASRSPAPHNPHQLTTLPCAGCSSSRPPPAEKTLPRLFLSGRQYRVGQFPVESMGLGRQVPVGGEIDPVPAGVFLVLKALKPG